MWTFSADAEDRNELRIELSASSAVLHAGAQASMRPAVTAEVRARASPPQITPEVQSRSGLATGLAGPVGAAAHGVFCTHSSVCVCNPVRTLNQESTFAFDVSPWPR